MHFKKKLTILVFCLAAILFVPTAHAQEASSTPAPTPKPVDSDRIGVDYKLPYPGILPDHPLYFLKAVRDGVLGFFITKPLKKAGYDLLQADKRVEASRMLIEQRKGKIDLAETTYSKAENYFEDAIAKTDAAKKEGQGDSEFVKKLRLANLKHQEVLSEMYKKLTNSEKKKFDPERKRAEQLGKKVKQLAP